MILPFNEWPAEEQIKFANELDEFLHTIDADTIISIFTMVDFWGLSEIQPFHNLARRREDWFLFKKTASAISLIAKGRNAKDHR